MIGTSAKPQSLRKGRRCGSTRRTLEFRESRGNWWIGTLARTQSNGKWATWLTSSSSPKTWHSTQSSMSLSYYRTRRVNSLVDTHLNLPQLR